MRKINQINNEINSSIRIPSSKSLTHRALMISALSNGRSNLKNALLCDDTIATMNCLREISVIIDTDSENNIIVDKSITTQPMENNSNNSISLYFNESGTTARFMTAVCSILNSNNTIHIYGEPTLNKRPIKQLIESVKEVGAVITYDKKEEELPITITPIKTQLTNEVSIQSNISSQYISALLIIAPMLQNGLTINLIGDGIVSKPYINLTIDTMRRFGVDVNKVNNRRYKVENQSYKPANIYCDGDYSSASYFLEALALKKGEIRLTGLNRKSMQGDKKILELMGKFGVDITHDDDVVKGIMTSEISPIEVDLTDCPDLVPTIVCVCSFANGISKISGIDHLRYKESDRIESIMENLSNVGIDVNYKNNLLTIQGNPHLQLTEDVTIKTHSDHRIAMSFAIIALRTGHIIIDDEKCVYKSYPNFWSDLHKL